MRSLLVLGLLVTLAVAQRPGGGGRPGGRPSPCSDGSRPQRPPRDQRGPPTCDDGSSPLCSDGSAPQKPEKPGPCSDGSTPSCGGASPVCPDGSALSTTGRRPCTGGRPVCADASLSPLCADGSEPGRVRDSVKLFTEYTRHLYQVMLAHTFTFIFFGNFTIFACIYGYTIMPYSHCSLHTINAQDSLNGKPQGGRGVFLLYHYALFTLFTPYNKCSRFFKWKTSGGPWCFFVISILVLFYFYRTRVRSLAMLVSDSLTD